jgi:acetyl-CoA acetyltransferase
MGCVDAIGEAGGDIARAATFEAGYATEAPGIQINRFCASGLDAINFGTAKIAQGADDIVIAGGVESMSRIGIGAQGGAWFMDPSVNIPGLLHAAGHFRRPDRHQIRLLAAMTSTPMRGKPEARGQCLGEGLLRQVGGAGQGHQRPDHSRP